MVVASVAGVSPLTMGQSPYHGHNLLPKLVEHPSRRAATFRNEHSGSFPSKRVVSPLVWTCSRVGHPTGAQEPGLQIQLQTNRDQQLRVN